MIIFLPKYLKAEVCGIRNRNKSIEKKKIRRKKCPVRRCRCGYYRRSGRIRRIRRIRRVRRCRKFRKLGNGEGVRRIRETNIR